MATFTPQQITQSGVLPVYTGSLSITDTHKFRNNGRQLIHVKKSGAGACNLVIVTPKTVLGLAVGDVTVVVPATTGDMMVGPFAPDAFNDAGGDVGFTVSEATGLTLGVFSL